ncbi:MAG: hypothetical protein IJ419_13855 [Agathobacter sp.]|nr:hypothetical protein [Agathobacter sp.]
MTQEKKWTKQRILKYCANGFLIISLIVFVIFGSMWIRNITYVYNEVKNIHSDGFVPEDMQEFSPAVALQLMQDIRNHTYDADYYEVKYKQMCEKADNLNSYNMRHIVQLSIDDTNATGEYGGQIKMEIDVDMNKSYGRGTIKVGYINPIRFPIYIEETEDEKIVYLRFQQRWVKFDVSNQEESLFHLSPKQVSLLIKDNWAVGPVLFNQLNSYVGVMSHKMIYGPYKFFLPTSCDGIAQDTPILTINDTNDIQGIRKGGLGHPIDFKELTKYANEKNDKILQHALNNYTIVKGNILSSYSNHNQIAEIIIPEEVLAAEYMTEEEKDAFMQYVVNFIDVEIAAIKEMEKKEY